MSYNLVNMWTPTSLYAYKAPYYMQPTKLAIHNTGNSASARNEVKYMNSNYNYVSYHVAVDDKEVVQAIPFNRNAFHTGDGVGANSGNRTAIGIEICYSMDNGYSGPKSERYKQAEDNAALYAAHVLHQYGWGIDRMYQHYWFSLKDCPHKMRATNTWAEFENKVNKYLQDIKKGNKPKATTQKSKSTNVVKFDKEKYRKRSTKAYAKGIVDGLGAEMRHRTGTAKSGFNWNKKVGGDLKPGDTVYIFETHDGWGRIYTGEAKGEGSNRWIWLGRVAITKTY